VVACIRPEHIALSRIDGAAPRIIPENVLVGKVTRLALSASGISVHIDAGWELRALVAAQVVEDLSLGVRDEVRVAFKASAVHVIRPVEGDDGPGRNRAAGRSQGRS
jgi:molybdopterin-binding protein